MPAAPRVILGISFFMGTIADAVERMQSGGLIVVPAAPALVGLPANTSYREALVNADVVLPDSAFMVLIWNLIERDHVRRLSGLAYLRALLCQPEVVRPGDCVWVMSSRESADRNLAWLARQGIEVPDACVYVAPLYGPDPCDPVLVELLERLRPRHVILTIGGGVQEQLGWYLKKSLSYAPAIHCIGAAIAFLSGVQARIPVWADRLYLGWLFRSFGDPVRFVPRYWAARKLLGLLLRYRSRSPVTID